MTIGRGPSNAIAIDDPSVSGQHARLVLLPDGRWLLEDLGSKNGTYLNSISQRVDRCLLRPQDQVLFGSCRVPAQALVRQAEGLLGRSAPPAPERHAEPRQHRGQEQAGAIGIGRHASNTIVLDYPPISRHHARLSRAHDGSWLLEDTGSRHGTFVNNRKRPIQGAVAVRQEDTVYFGSFKISALRLLRSAGRRQTTHAPASVPIIPGQALTLGRDPKCDIALDSAQVSWRHAKVLSTGRDRWVIEDLGSKNGTYVNGQRISRKNVGPQDSISLGSYELKLTSDNRVEARQLHGDLRIDADDLCFTVGQGQDRRLLLDHVNFTVFPSEFVGLMGLSGAGKTLLLLTLLGYMRPTQGRSLFNGRNLYSSYDQYKGMIGYVPQDDIVHGELTVNEALTYAAKLRLDSSVSDQEIQARVESSLRLLGLIDEAAGVDVRHVKVNPSHEKGISGGQRKRVYLAMELMTDPPVLFLDEPTSGLSCVDTIRVMRILRKLADSGKTIIITLHQPDIESYQQLDNVLILDHGKLVFYGQAWPDSLLFFNPGQPEAEVVNRAESGLLGLSRMPAPEWQKRYAASQHRKVFVEERRSSEFGLERAKPDGQRSIRWPFSWRQFSLLTMRNACLKLKDRVNTGILLCQAPVIALLLALIFHGQEQIEAPLFLLAISCLWLGTSNAAKEIVSERAVYVRERMLFLGIGEYVFSKYLVLSTVALLQAILLGSIAKGLLPAIKTPYPELLLICAGVILVGQALGLLVSSLARTQAAADTLVPLLIIPMVILGGGMMPLHKMKQDAARSMAGAMPSRWAYELFIQRENNAVEPGPQESKPQEQNQNASQAAPAAQAPPLAVFKAPTQEEAERMAAKTLAETPILKRTFKNNETSTESCLAVLAAMSALFLAASMATLKGKDTV